ncbi:bifunctional UDP-N-acetylmuramoyl-tripeptide:D-alanyl-D-alanine ligase/alanine racemase [Olivibacter sp. XZL3]|uniref:bifunctional UDP-N-acetylmuramoyl-tripeptide:D-alanyl-D-alanine ligase/alanine racemase n=1 Tax=Olivibacter sp. XZL3 TaxID=1735116 RepID=UPI001065ED9B|nr:bifunctional UDP-N-acetylmuramoyl-tripeptide:D-alanyl-D-alanine ligase/alanine racemase [Olivibacter sp. XZL3]
MSNKVYNIKEIADVIGATSIQLVDPAAVINTLAYDSRKITNSRQALFFALVGRRDGHQFLQEAYRSGVRNFVVHAEAFEIADCPHSNWLVVPNTLHALQLLAAYHRRQFDYPVIAITGSNGKTIVKEWLYQLLSPEYEIVRSPKSYNSQLGVPLSLWQMDAQHNLAIIEAGISKVGEMEAIEVMVKPTLGVLTNIGHAHDDGFASIQEKTREKLRLFSVADMVVYNPTYVDATIAVPGRQHFTWTIGEGATLSVDAHWQAKAQRYVLEANVEGQAQRLTVPFTDRASIENLICCWAVMLVMGYEMPVIMSRLQTLLPISMRLELKKGINNCSIIDDSYSNDLSSLLIALDFLKQQRQHPHRTVILSDLPIAAQDTRALYVKIATMLEGKGIDRLVGVGEHLRQQAALFQMDAQFFDTTEELLAHLPQLGIQNSTVLIKGSRVFGFERVSRALTLQTHETTLEINLNALEHNLNTYKTLLKPGTKLMVMVKAFSYGSGSFEIANLLQFNKVDYLTVAYVDEGIALRKSGITLPIVVMSPGPETFEQLIAYQLEPEIYSFAELEAFMSSLSPAGPAPYPIHIKVDTGMHRLGFEPDDLSELLTKLKSSDKIIVKSVFSHLAASGSPEHDAFTLEQIGLFDSFTKNLASGLGYHFVRHIANTSAISRFPQAQFDMVRLGIGLYGVSADDYRALPLQSVARLRTGITQIKRIKEGDTVGYNRKGRLNGEGTIATVKIGYADGYSRRFGNGVGKMRIKGHLVPTVGDICMDMCMLDVTGIDVAVGEEVLVMGDELSPEYLAKAIGTIPYEILTGISQRVRRIYYYE